MTKNRLPNWPVYHSNGASVLFPAHLFSILQSSLSCDGTILHRCVETHTPNPKSDLKVRNGTWEVRYDQNSPQLRILWKATVLVLPIFGEAVKQMPHQSTLSKTSPKWQADGKPPQLPPETVKIMTPEKQNKKRNNLMRKLEVGTP